MNKDSTRYKILDTAASCFSKNGFHKTSVDEIASLAKVAKGSVYYNFKNKDDLLFNVIKWGIDLINDDIDKIYAKDLSEEETFHEVLKTYIKISINHPELTSLVFNAIPDSIGEDAAGKINEAFCELTESTANLLRHGADLGFIKNMNFHLAAAGMFGLITGMCAYYRKHLREENPEIVYEKIFQAFYSGIVSPGESSK
jgi:TetR/AcrR family transcriptional regulator